MVKVTAVSEPIGLLNIILGVGMVFMSFYVSPYFENLFAETGTMGLTSELLVLIIAFYGVAKILLGFGIFTYGGLLLWYFGVSLWTVEIIADFVMLFLLSQSRIGLGTVLQMAVPMLVMDMLNFVCIGYFLVEARR